MLLGIICLSQHLLILLDGFKLTRCLHFSFLFLLFLVLLLWINTHICYISISTLLDSNMIIKFLRPFPLILKDLLASITIHVWIITLKCIQPFRIDECSFLNWILSFDIQILISSSSLIIMVFLLHWLLQRASSFLELYLFLNKLCYLRVLH